MKVPVENKIVLGFLVTALALAGAGWLSYQSTTDYITSEAWVTHTYQVISQLESTLATVNETDTEQRGYLLTGNPQFLSRRQAAAAQIPGQLDQLQQLTSDNPAQQEAIKRLRAVVQTQISSMDDRVAVFQKSGLAAALAKEPIDKTEAAMEDIQAQTAQIRETEEKLLVHRKLQSHAIAVRTEMLVIFGSLIAILFGWIMVLLGRSELKRRALAEAQLQHNEERLRLMLDSVKDYAIMLLAPDGKVASWNEGAERIKGYKSEEILGKHFSVFYPPQALQEKLPEKLLSDATAKGRFEDTGWRVRKDGSQFWANVVATAVHTPAGELLGFVKVTRDLTERKRAEEIQAERDRYFELSRELICVLGFDGYFKALNPAWKWILGFTPEEMQARPFIEFIHPDDRPATLTEAKKLMEGNQLIYFENRYLCKDGSWRWIAWSASAGIPEGNIYGTGRDITDRKSAQEEIEKLNANLQDRAVELESANKELEAFSYSVSHDLRAPLRHIDGFVKMLDKQAGEKLDDRGRRYLGIIADSAQKMGALIDDLLIFSRMSRAELHCSKVSTEALVHEAVNGLQPDTNGRRINWNIGALPEVDADPSMLQQVWVNLISNAVKYTRPRDPAEIEIGSQPPENGAYVFFVQDNGVGFDMQYAHKLFGVFQRLHRAEEFEGTGIGLANVSRIIHRHGGRVWAEGKPNAGATFYFSLPQRTTKTKT